MDIKKDMKSLEDHTPDVAVAEQAALGISNEEFREYAELSDIFQGKRLRTTTRKIESVESLHFDLPRLMNASFRVLPQLLLLYLISYVDRSNVGMFTLILANQKQVNNRPRKCQTLWSSR